MRGGRAHLFSDMVVYKLWWEKMDINFRNCREILTKDGGRVILRIIKGVI